MAKEGGGGVWVLLIEKPLNTLHFRQFFKFYEGYRPFKQRKEIESGLETFCWCLYSTTPAFHYPGMGIIKIKMKYIKM